MKVHLENCLSFKYLTVDTEGYVDGHTSAAGLFDKGLLGLSIAHPGLTSMYFPLGHKEDVNVSPEILELIKYTIANVPYRIMHNAAHDLIALRDFVDILEHPFVCTMIMGHMVDENVMSKGLDYMHKHHCGGEGKQMDPLMLSIIKTMGWYYVPFELLNAYGEVDALITMELFLTLLPQYEQQFGPLWSPNVEPSLLLPNTVH